MGLVWIKTMKSQLKCDSLYEVIYHQKPVYWLLLLKEVEYMQQQQQLAREEFHILLNKRLSPHLRRASMN